MLGLMFTARDVECGGACTYALRARFSTTLMPRVDTLHNLYLTPSETGKA